MAKWGKLIVVSSFQWQVNGNSPTFMASSWP